jgi:membrane protein implicated in regulation of membrane protease activity
MRTETDRAKRHSVERPSKNLNSPIIAELGKVTELTKGQGQVLVEGTAWASNTTPPPPTTPKPWGQ